MKSFLVIICLLTSIAGITQVYDTQDSTKWERIGKLDGKYEFYTRTEYEGKSIGKMRVWVKHFKEETQVDDRIYFDCDEHDLFNIDYENKKLQILGISTWGSDGKLIAERYVAVPTWADIDKGSIGEQIFLRVCKYFNKN